jgi:hypothetical protein
MTKVKPMALTWKRGVNELAIDLTTLGANRTSSLLYTPRAATNPDLDWASGCSRIIEELYQRCSSQGRYAAKCELENTHLRKINLAKERIKCQPKSICSIYILVITQALHLRIRNNSCLACIYLLQKRGCSALFMLHASHRGRITRR